ncbi:MAG: hypothetical protein MHPSP_003302, partial [Paramarteilia canceri]
PSSKIIDLDCMSEMESSSPEHLDFSCSAENYSAVHRLFLAVFKLCDVDSELKPLFDGLEDQQQKNVLEGQIVCPRGRSLVHICVVKSHHNAIKWLVDELQANVLTLITVDGQSLF